MSLVLLVLTGLSAPRARAQTENPILGDWIGTSASNKDVRVTVERNALVVNGQRIPLRIVAPGVLEVGSGEDAERSTFVVNGDTLTIKDSESTTTWKRAGAKKKPMPVPKGNPLGGRPRGNPLGDPPGNPAPDPFARRFKGDGLEVVLRGSAASGYTGTLKFRGTTYPAKAMAKARGLRGSFRAGENSFEFTAKLDGDRLTLATGGKQYRLIGDKQKAAAPANPLGGGGPGYGTRPAPPTGKAFTSRKAGLTCRLPQGWSVMSETTQGCLVNPGFVEGQRRDVVFSLHCLPLDQAGRTMEITKLLARELPSARQSLAGDGVKTSEPEQAIAVANVGGQKAAVVTMKAETSQQLRGVVWLAMRVENGKALVCTAIFLAGKEAQFQARIEKVFGSLEPAR